MWKCNCHALWWETVAKARVSMSDYYQSLEAPAKDRYLGKLQLLGLNVKMAICMQPITWRSLLMISVGLPRYIIHRYVMT